MKEEKSAGLGRLALTAVLKPDPASSSSSESLGTHSARRSMNGHLMIERSQREVHARCNTPELGSAGPSQ